MKVYTKVPLLTNDVSDVRIQRLKIGGVSLKSRLVWALERDHGQRFIHLKAIFPLQKVFPGDLRAEFQIQLTEDPAKAMFQHADPPVAKPSVESVTLANGLRAVGVLPALASLILGWQQLKKTRNRNRTTSGPLMLLLIALMGVAVNQRTSASASNFDSVTLTNGIQVVSVHFPSSTNLSIFTFVPMSLTSDGPNQAQWSHLVEHLIIRSTMPANSAQANAETLPDHMRLDFYGTTGNWHDGLSHHRRWLEGVPFTEANLAAEKPKVIAECDFTARNSATHKFAVAAWSQGLRHGAKHVSLKGDVTKAALADVQRFRDERFAASNKVTVCIVGGLDAKRVFVEAEKQLGELRLSATATPASKAVSTNLDLTWDLDARHLLVTWPIPDFRQPDHAALMVAAQWLNMQLASDPDLEPQIGMAFAGADLTTPEGSFFFISAALRPGAEVDAARKAILRQVERLATSVGESAQTAMIGRQLAASLTEIPDARTIKAQAPPGVTLAMLEGNLGLQAGMHAHRYRSHLAVLAQQLADVSPRQAQQAVRGHLTLDKAAVCTLRPATPPGQKQ